MLRRRIICLLGALVLLMGAALAEELPELTKELTEKALRWREALEKNWDENFAANYSLA